MIAQVQNMPKTCKGCKHQNNESFSISPCDRYSLGTHKECYDKMDEDISAEGRAFFETMRGKA